MDAVKARTLLAVVCVGIGLVALQGRPVAAQAFFESGYVVTLEGDTLRGEIDNREWVRSPKRVRFRRGEAEPVQAFTPHQIAAFYVSGELYERRAVRIDETSLRAGETVERGPSTRTDTVFLTTLVKGALSLYLYRDERVHFYLEDHAGIGELIHHQYLTLRDGMKYQVTEERYQQQVAQVAALNCPAVETEDVSYHLSALKRFTEACNRQSALGRVRFVREPRRVVLHHELLVGATRTKLNVGSTDFSPSRAFTFGYALAFERGGAHGRRTVLLGLQLRSFEMHGLERYGVLRDVVIEADYLRTSIGYRHQIRAGDWRPFVETDFVVASPLRYRAEGEWRWNRRDGVTVPVLPANWFTPGVALGAGLAYRQLRATLKVERTITISSADFAFPVYTQLTLGYAF